MAETKATYATVHGFVQFEPNEREYDGGQLRDISIKPSNGDPNKLIRVTLWPEWSHVPVEQGDLVAADGVFTRDTYTANDGTKKTSLQISAKKYVNVNGKRYDPEGDSERKVTRSNDTEESDLF